MTETRPELKKEISAIQFFTLGFGTIIGVGWVVVLGRDRMARKIRVLKKEDPLQ